MKRFLACQSDHSCSWQILNSLLNRNKCDSQILTELHNENDTITERTMIANKFNDNFIGVGKSIADKIPQSNLSFEAYFANKQRISNSCV